MVKFVIESTGRASGFRTVVDMVVFETSDMRVSGKKFDYDVSWNDAKNNCEPFQDGKRLVIRNPKSMGLRRYCKDRSVGTEALALKARK